MKRLFGNLASILGCALIVSTLAHAAQLKEARVTQIVNDVKLLPEQAAPRPAAVSDTVREGTAVRTGTQSRSELTFTDLTITRLGANTIFSFNEGTRVMNLRDGAILFQVPKGSGGATIKTAAVTAAVTGTTGIGEAHPPTATDPHPTGKWFCLEGKITLYLPSGESLELLPGKMVVTDGTSFTKVMDFDIGKLVNSSLFFIGYDTELASLPLITFEQQKQFALMMNGGFVYTNLVGYLDPTSQQEFFEQIVNAQESNPAVAELSPSPTPTPPITPTPTPSKFGTPTVISSPDPYVITSGTTISTDPSITTNGQIDYGKIWRGPAQDGPLSAFIFGSTSAFDTASGFDTELNGDMGGAGFKFASLQLTGNPTVSTTNGAINLGLIAVNGITSGGPGGVLTFAGIRGLLLATQNGSINLGSEISFSGLHSITFYARGAGSMLTLTCDVSTTNKIRLYGEGGIELSSDLSTDTLLAFTGGDFDLTNGSITAETISITSHGDVNIDPSSMDFTVGNSFSSTAGGNLNVQIGGSLSLNGAADFDTLVLPGTTVTNGANVTLNVGSGLTNSSSSDLSRLRVENESAHIGTGGNISLTVGGNLTTAQDFEASVRNTTGQIDNGGNIDLTVNGSVSTGGAFNVLVENYNQTANPAGHIGTGGNIFLSTGGNLTADFASIAVNNRGGGVIGSDVNLTIDIAGALTTLHDGVDFLGNPGSLSVAISSRYDDTSGNTAKSSIGGDATLDFHADSGSIGGLFNITISDRGGTIGGNALLNFDVTHDLAILGADIPDAFLDAAVFELLNDAGIGGGALSPFGGTIHGDAILQVTAANLSVPSGSLDVLLQNQNGGVIDGNATVNFNLTGNLTTGNFATFQLTNHQNSFSNGLPVGSIGSAATLNISAADISVGNDFLAQVLNHRGVDAPGPGGGSIGTDALLSITANSFTISGESDAKILNLNNGNSGGVGGMIGGDATIDFDVTGSVSTGGAANVLIENENVPVEGFGGIIDGNATIKVSAGDITANSLLVQINNTGGSIGGAATINMNVAGNATATTDAMVAIYGSDATGSAAINANGGNYNAGGTFLTFIDGSGTIAFDNVTAQADVLKVGAFGANGVLNIGGGTLSADTTLKLYAPGSSGEINFVSDVTLSSGSGTIIAGDRITIQPTRVVTIAGTGGAAQIFTNDPNYNFTPQEGYAGPPPNPDNGSFGGLGANDPQPLSDAPAFDDPPASPRSRRPAGPNVTSRTPSRTNVASSRRIDHDLKPANKKPTGTVIKVSDSGQLLSLLDGTAPGPGGKITVPASNGTNSRNSDRTNAARRLNADRVAVNRESAPLSRAGRLP